MYTSHYMEEVQAIASRVVIMDQGQIIKQGTVEELVQTIQHEEKVNLEVTNPEAISVESLEKIAGVMKVIVSGNRITVISAAGSGNLDRIISLVKEHAGLLGIQSEKPNLEDVFLTLTGKQLRDEGDES